MSQWTPQDWVVLIGGSFIALSTFIGAVLGAVNLFLANIAKLKGEENAKKIDKGLFQTTPSGDQIPRLETANKKIDENTALTRAGTATITANARVAATAATAAAQKTDAIAEQLNGKLDDKIRAIIKDHTDPLVKAFSDHNDQDQRNMDTITTALAEISKKLPESKH